MEPHIQFTQNTRGNIILKFNQQPFTMNRSRGEIRYWECFKGRNKNVRCNVRITTVGTQIKAYKGVHNHD